MKLKLDTIILYVQNVNSLKSFYINILGLEIVEDDQEIWAFLKAGNAYIGLHKIGDQYLNKIREGFKFSNNAKLVFEIEEDIHKARESLLRKNVSMRAVKSFEGYDFWLCDGEDPEGNVFQLKQRKQVV